MQITDTDAEGRRSLASRSRAAHADEENLDLLIDAATLTGAARVALGPDLPPFFTDDEQLAEDLIEASLETDDPFWRMPLYRGYEKNIRAQIADLTTSPSGGMAGSIMAALLLQAFRRQVDEMAALRHLRLPGRSVRIIRSARGPGAIRALYRYLRTHQRLLAWSAGSARRLRLQSRPDLLEKRKRQERPDRSMSVELTASQALSLACGTR